MQLNFAAREVTIKLVYYGPALSGKTTNLRALHELTSEDSRGRLMTLETKDDRTLFFDMLPLVFRGATSADKPLATSGGSGSGMSLRLKVFTVPGQVLHSSTRRLVLQGADGVAFIADSQVAETGNNAASFMDLRANLKELGLSVKTLPLVIQFNKRDMPSVRSDAEIGTLAGKGREPVFKASAVKGDGVLETFFGLLHLTWSKLDAEHQLAKKLGLDTQKFLGAAAEKLGYRGTTDDLLRACVGGSLHYTAPHRGGATMTMPHSLDNPLDALALDQTLRLEDLVNREALTEMLRSFYALFGIPLRIYSGENLLLGDAGKEHEVCAYVNTLMKGRAACSKTVGEVKGLDAGDGGDSLHPCFTGAHYRVVAIEYDGRRIGRLIVGPYLPAAVAEAPTSLLQIDPAVVPERATSLLLKMPRAREETIARIAQHLKATLDLILFSGHKALLTSTMHLASVKESYRELQEKNAKLQETYDRLKELDRLKSNFLATVSHELRTPLTSIIGYSEMLNEGIAGELNGEQKEFVGTIHEKGEQLLQLIMSLLDLSKLESGTLSMKRKPTAMASVLSEAVTTISPSARKKGVAIKLEAEPRLIELRADPERLRQVFINLCDNALKFTPRGGTITITARTMHGSADPRAEDDDGFALLAPTQAKLEVRVIDTGIGIPPKERQKVFDAFYQVDSSSTREYGGTGLGLSIVKRIVTAHQGTIVIEDNHPHGAVFIVTLPASSGTNGRSIPPASP